MCQLWQLLKILEDSMSLRKRGATDCESQVPNHQETSRETFFNPMSQARRTQARHRATDCISLVSRHWEICCKRSERLQPFKEGLSGEPPDSHYVVVKQPVVEPKEKTPDDDCVHLPQFFGDALPADHKVLSEENVSRLQLWCRTFILIGYKATQRKEKLRKRRRKVCKSSCRKIRNQI